MSAIANQNQVKTMNTMVLSQVTEMVSSHPLSSKDQKGIERT